jgi:hypothetical protein
MALELLLNQWDNFQRILSRVSTSNLYKLESPISLMGQILKTRTSSRGKIIFHLELTLKEAQHLKNHSKKIYLFSENLCIHDAQIIEKGVNHEAKSVKIPLSLKTRKNPKFSEITYQKIETDSKIFYIAIATKDPLSD